MAPDNELKFLEQPEIRGVSKGLITNLYDIINKFGLVIPEESTLRFSSGDLGNGLRLLMTKGLQPNSALLVYGSETPSGGISMLETTQGQILWDKTLSAKNAKIAVAKIDAVALSAGLIDTKTRERKPIPQEISIGQLGKYKVEEVFKKQGSAFMVMPGQDPDEVLQQFDCPDELFIYRDPFIPTYITIHHQRDHEYLKRRRGIVLEVLAVRGLTPEKITDLSIQEIVEIREEIARRSKEEG